VNVWQAAEVSRSGVLIFAFAIVLLLVAGPAQAAKPKPKLAVSKVNNPPRTATAGERLTATGRVANRGRRSGKGRVRLYLNDRRQRAGALAIGSKRVRVRARRSTRFSTSVTIPTIGRLEAGDYALIACIRERGGSKGAVRCRSARSKVIVSAPNAPPATPPDPPAGPGPPTFTAGARTLGDPLLPQIGNGGYDALNYDIELDFDPGANRFDSAVTTITARATQNLSEFSLDFQDLAVQEVLVDGAQAEFSQVEATPDLSDDADVTQPMKLVVTPPAGIPDGRRFLVEVDYSGSQPQVFTDPDTSQEGWIPACYDSGTPVVRTCDSFFVVGEPMGSQAWFPSNNYPSDKATFDTAITVPTGDTAFGVGELVDEEPSDNGDGTTTWAWSEDDPTATYLVTASNGDFDYSENVVVESLTGRRLPIYNAIDPSATPTQEANLATRLGRTEEMMNFLAARYGPYPFDSNGALVDRAPNVGYALEVQGKSHYASLNTSESTILHEISHQWFGNSATLQQWSDIWFNEGWAQWSEWLWNSTPASTAPEPPPEQQFDSEYANPDNDWSIAPAVLDNDPANLFVTFPTYTRGAMTLEGYREIVGSGRFYNLARALQSQFAYGNVSTREFIDAAKDMSGLSGAKLALLEDYFQQWLYGEQKPTITPDSFN